MGSNLHSKKDLPTAFRTIDVSKEACNFVGLNIKIENVADTVQIKVSKLKVR